MSHLDFWITRKVQQFESDCYMAIRAIRAARRVEDVTRAIAYLHPSCEIRALSNTMHSRVKREAEAKAAALLEKLEDRHLYAAYRVLCGNFPRLAQQTMRRIHLANDKTQQPSPLAAEQ